jgi:phosphonate transport system substrate-binding protein
MYRLIAVIVLGSYLIAASSAGGADLQKRTYTIAVIPSAPPVVTHTQWTPFVERLTEGAGIQLRLKVYETMAAFERDIWSGDPDFIFASPIQTVVAHTRSGYEPLVRGGNPVSVRLFVRRDSPVRTLADLSGKTIAFVGNKNLCSVFIRHMLNSEKGKFSYLAEYTGSTKNVIRSVLLGKNAAGAVFVPELDREAEETKQQMRKIVDTPEIAPHPLSAHPRVPQSVRNRITRAVLGLAAIPGGKELAASVRLQSPVAAEYARDYRSLETVDIVGLTDWGN